MFIIYLFTHITQVVWTIFENCIQEKSHLFTERHLDQILLCCIYIVSRVLSIPLKFEELTGKYQTQPQAHGMIFRSVLLNNCKEDTNTNIPYGMRGDIVQFYNKIFLKGCCCCCCWWCCLYTLLFRNGVLC